MPVNIFYKHKVHLDNETYYRSFLSSSFPFQMLKCYRVFHFLLRNPQITAPSKSVFENRSYTVNVREINVNFVVKFDYI